MKVFKYSIGAGCLLKLPKNSQVLTADFQGDSPMLWVLIDPDETRLIERDFVVVATGDHIDERATHIATVFKDFCVWHVFELPF